MSGHAVEHPDDGWFRARGEAAGDVFFAVRTHPDRAVEFLSGTFETVVGVPVAGVIESIDVLDALVDPRDADTYAALFALPAGTSARNELRWIGPTGAQIWTEVVAEAIERPDGSVAVEGSAHDITSLKVAQRALAESEQKYRLLAENAWDVIWTMEIDGTISYVSPAVERVRGITPEEAKSQTLDQIHTPDSAAKVATYFAELYSAMAAGDVPPHYRGEREYYRKDGSIMYGELDVIPQVDEDGHVIRILGVTRDVSERRQFEKELSRLAVTDPLTGTWNRRHGEELFNADLAEARRYGPNLSMLMIDIDHFKDINDTYGHQVGDLVLMELTRRFTDRLRVGDTLVRWGGEEFVVVSRHCDIDAAVQLAQTLRAIVADAPFDVVGTVTVSIGAAQLGPDDTLAMWMDRADRAMYAAKASGRNAVRAADGA